MYYCAEMYPGGDRRDNNIGGGGESSEQQVVYNLGYYCDELPVEKPEQLCQKSYRLESDLDEQAVREYLPRAVSVDHTVGGGEE